MSQQTVNQKSKVTEDKGGEQLFPSGRQEQGEDLLLARDCQTASLAEIGSVREISVSRYKFQSVCSLLCVDRLFSYMCEHCSWPLVVTPVSFLPGSLISRAGWYDAASLKIHKPHSIRLPLPVIHLGFGTRVLWDLKRFEMYLLTVFLLGVITDLIFIGLWQNMAITVEVPSFNVLTWYF